MFQAAYRRHVGRLYPKDGTRYWWAETHSKTAQQQNYKPQRMSSYLYPTIQSYPTRSNSDTVQQMSWRPAFLSSYVLMNQSRSSLPRIIRLPRSSQNTRVPIQRESVLKITSVLHPNRLIEKRSYHVSHHLVIGRSHLAPFYWLMSTATAGCLAILLNTCIVAINKTVNY